MADAAHTASRGSIASLTPGARDVLMLIGFTILQVASFHVAFDALDRRDPYTLWARISAGSGVLFTAAILLRLHLAQRRETLRIAWAATYVAFGTTAGAVYAFIVLPEDFATWPGSLFLYFLFHGLIWLPLLGISILMAIMLNTREQKPVARAVMAGPFLFAAGLHGVTLSVMALMTAGLAETASRAHATPAPALLLVVTALAAAALATRGRTR